MPRAPNVEEIFRTLPKWDDLKMSWSVYQLIIYWNTFLTFLIGPKFAGPILHLTAQTSTRWYLSAWLVEIPRLSFPKKSPFGCVNDTRGPSSLSLRLMASGILVAQFIGCCISHSCSPASGSLTTQGTGDHGMQLAYLSLTNR